MSKAVLKGGIVGCGVITQAAHLPAWRHTKGASIVSVCDQNIDAAKETARRWGIPRVYDDLLKMLQSEKLDFVDVCTPPATHHKLSIKAMEAGMHVLVEKPMATSLDEADEMVSASKKHGVKLCVSHNFLFTPAIRTASSLIASGAIGNLIAVEGHDLLVRYIVFKGEKHWSYNLPGGIFGEHSPHLLYVGSAFLGKIKSVQAIAMKFSGFPGVRADELKVLVEAEKGLGVFTNSCNSSKFSFTFDIYGTEGKLHIDNVKQTITHSRSRSNRTYALVWDQLDLALQMLSGAAYVSIQSLLGRKWYKLGQYALFEKFVESVRDNLAPPVTGEDGRENVRVLQEVWKQIG
jgi:predicted dehydrogenase